MCLSNVGLQRPVTLAGVGGSSFNYEDFIGVVLLSFLLRSPFFLVNVLLKLISLNKFLNPFFELLAVISVMATVLVVHAVLRCVPLFVRFIYFLRLR